MKSLAELLRNPATRWPALLVSLFVVLQTLYGPMDLTVFTRSESIDLVTFIKLLISGLCGLVVFWGLANYSKARDALFAPRSLMLFAFIFLTLIGATSGASSTSLPSSIINLIHILFTIVAIVAIGIRSYSFAMVFGALLSTVYAYYLYFLVPERGVFLEPISMTESVARLGGVGHPNGVGRTSIIGLLLTVYLYRTKDLPVVLAIVLGLLFGASLLQSKSRTASIAGLIGLCLLYSDYFNVRNLALGFSVVSIVGLLTVFGVFVMGGEKRFVDKGVKVFTKSGDASELASGTGRTKIWSESIKKFGERPVFGYGLNSSPEILREFSQSPHNAILYASLSGGIFAGLLMLVMQIQMAWGVFSSPNLMIRAFCGFFSLSFIIEDTVFEAFPGPGTMLWFVCILHPVLVDSPIKGILRRSHPVLPSPKIVVAGE